MALILAVMLFVGNLIPRMSVEQANHLPELLTHYQQHQREEGKDLTFWTFLLDHYLFDSQHHKCPNHSHSRLPVFDGGSSGYDCVPAFRLICEIHITELATKAVYHLPFFYTKQVLFSLLQPPR